MCEHMFLFLLDVPKNEIFESCDNQTFIYLFCAPMKGKLYRGPGVMGFRKKAALQARGGGGTLFNLLGGAACWRGRTPRAVDSAGVRAGVTLASDDAVAAVLLGERVEGRLDDAVCRRGTRCRVDSF